jgi:hypothetical protein
MSIDELVADPSSSDADEHAYRRSVEPTDGEARPIASAEHLGADRFDDLKARIAELDAIAWNLPGRRRALLAPPDSTWPSSGDAA